jgi:hypothetical protein
MVTSQIYDDFEDCPNISIRNIRKNFINKQKRQEEYLLRKALPKNLLKKYMKLTQR